MKRNKSLTTLALIFALVLIVGVVYAAASGVLTFNGTANLANLGPTDYDVKLEIVDVVEPDTLPNGSTGTMVISSDGQTATIECDLKEPGDELEFKFKVENTGDDKALMTVVPITVDNPAVAFDGTYLDLTGESLDGGDTSGEYTLIVEWDDQHDDQAGETVTFSFTIDYEYDPS